MPHHETQLALRPDKWYLARYKDPLPDQDSPEPTTFYLEFGGVSTVDVVDLNKLITSYPSHTGVYVPTTFTHDPASWECEGDFDLKYAGTLSIIATRERIAARGHFLDGVGVYFQPQTDSAVPVGKVLNSNLVPYQPAPYEVVTATDPAGDIIYSTIALAESPN